MPQTFVGEEYRVRVADGYARVPTASTMRMIRRPAERADALVLLRKSLADQLANVDAAIDDTANELHYTYRVKWEAVARRFGLGFSTIYQRAKARRELLAQLKAETSGPVRRVA